MVKVFFQSVILVLGILLGVAYLTIIERKYLSGIQRRRGPNVVFLYGLLQAVSDGVKLVLKEFTIPTSSQQVVFFIAPFLTFVSSLGVYGVIPFGFGSVVSDIFLGILYILAVSSVGVYGIIFGGWSSNSKYSYLGGVRSTAQMISYEVVIGFVFLNLLLFTGGEFNLSGLVYLQSSQWNCFSLFPLFVIYFVAIVAETNRHPFDLPEAESELVSGYNVEYSGGAFALFFLGEYGSIIGMSSLLVLLFLGGWFIPFFGYSIWFFVLKVFVILLFFVWFRAAYPRYRYDQLLVLCWKSYLPLSVGYLVLLLGFSFLGCI